MLESETESKTSRTMLFAELPSKDGLAQVICKFKFRIYTTETI